MVQNHGTQSVPANAEGPVLNPAEHKHDVDVSMYELSEQHFCTATAVSMGYHPRSHTHSEGRLEPAQCTNS